MKKPYEDSVLETKDAEEFENYTLEYAAEPMIILLGSHSIIFSFNSSKLNPVFAFLTIEIGDEVIVSVLPTARPIFFSP